MKNPSNMDKSAQQVGNLFPSGKDSLKKEVSKKSEKKRTYNLEKNAPIPSSIEDIHVLDRQAKKTSSKKPRSVKLSNEKKSRVSIEQIYCSANALYPLSFIEKAEALHAKRIKTLKCKEQFVAARNLRKLSHEMQERICRQIHHNVTLLNKEKSNWDLLSKEREERYFQIDRIIKYLAEP